jgi:hypothetical protein
MDFCMKIRSFFLVVLFGLFIHRTVFAQSDSVQLWMAPKETRAHISAVMLDPAVVGEAPWIRQFDVIRPVPNVFPQTAAAKKSPFIGVLYSFLLPGMGEVYADRTDRMYAPLISEAALWLGVAGFNAYGNSLRHDARLFAQTHAGVDQSGKADQYFVDIGNYSDIYQYNDYRLVERNLSALYDINNPSFFWKWDSDGNRAEYKDQRIKSDKMYNAVSFFIVGLIANRIWSAIETAVFVKNYNKNISSLERLPSMNSELMSFGGRVDGIRLLFTKSF